MIFTEHRVEYLLVMVQGKAAVGHFLLPSLSLEKRL